jgi:hypothetical protein
MRIPASIHLNGNEINIKLIHNMFRDTGKRGDYSIFDHSICLDADMSEQYQGIFLFHELIEYIKDVYLMDDDKFPHDYIQPIAITFHELFNTNQLDNAG